MFCYFSVLSCSLKLTLNKDRSSRIAGQAELLKAFLNKYKQTNARAGQSVRCTAPPWRKFLSCQRSSGRLRSSIARAEWFYALTASLNKTHRNKSCTVANWEGKLVVVVLLWLGPLSQPPQPQALLLAFSPTVGKSSRLSQDTVYQQMSPNRVFLLVGPDDNPQSIFILSVKHHLSL